MTGQGIQAADCAYDLLNQCSSQATSSIFLEIGSFPLIPRLILPDYGTSAAHIHLLLSPQAKREVDMLQNNLGSVFLLASGAFQDPSGKGECFPSE